ARLSGLLTSWTTALIALPFAIEGISALIDHINKLNKTDLSALDPTGITSIQALNAKLDTALGSVGGKPPAANQFLGFSTPAEIVAAQGPSFPGYDAGRRVIGPRTPFNPFGESEDSY